MGIEFRIEITPHIESVDSFCDAVFEATEWRRIPASLTDSSGGIGVRSTVPSPNTSWRHVADVCHNADGSFYAVAHCTNGVQFLNALVDRLKLDGHSVLLDSDYY